MRKLLHRVSQWFINQETVLRDAYFSAATDRVDLERRIREWERDHLGQYG